MADVILWNQGASVTMVHAASDAAKAWVKENADVPGWAWMGDSFACEPRMLGDLVEGMRADGLVVA